MRRYLLHGVFALVISLMVLASFASIYRLHEYEQRLDQVVTQRTTKINLITAMYTAARERSVSLLKMLSMDDPFDREEEFEFFNALATRFAVARLALQELPLVDAEQALMDEHFAVVRKAVPLQLKVVDLLFNDDVEQATSVLINEAIPTQNQVLNYLVKLIEFQEQAANDSLSATRDSSSTTVRFLILITSIAVFLSAGMAIYVIRTLREDERQLRDYAETLEQKVWDRTAELSAAYEDLKMSQSQLVQSEKMASLGQLTAGIAHEIKNPLNFVNNFSDTAMEAGGEIEKMICNTDAEYLSSSENLSYLSGLVKDLRQDLEKIRRHGERANRIWRISSGASSDARFTRVSCPLPLPKTVTMH